MKIPKQFQHPYSEGSPLILKRLKTYSKRKKLPNVFKLSAANLKKIDLLNQEIKQFGAPKHLVIAHVNKTVQTGVFLSLDTPPLEKNSLIGVYTGQYELVESDLNSRNSYSYDVATELKLKKEELSELIAQTKKPTIEETYSIQTNAFSIGNYTRYINHSSLEPNIEAKVCRLPNGRIEVVLFSIKTILPGEQLLSNYGGQYWKALGIIPKDMIPSTYTLHQEKAKLSLKTPFFSKKLYEQLLPLRNTETEYPFQSTPISWKNHAKELSTKQLNLLDGIEEIILERALPRICSLNKSLIPIKKGTLLAPIPGKFTKKKSGISIFASKKNPLFFIQDPSFTSHLPEAPNYNVERVICFDPEKKELRLLLFTIQNIDANKPLILKKWEPILID